MSQKLSEANIQSKSKSNLFEFEKFLANKFNYKPEKNFKKLFNWTIKNPKLFWSSIWEFSNIKGIKNNKFYVQAGAGVVADSKPEKEYAETVNKAKALMRAVD